MRKVLVVSLLIFLVACGNVEEIDKSLSHVDRLTSEYELDDEFYKDTKQVFEMLEQARTEDRKLEFEEELLMAEYEGKYENFVLNEREEMVLAIISVMSTSTETTQQLDSNQNFYEDMKNTLLDYMQFDNVKENNEIEDVEEDEIETLFDKDVNITLVDNDDLKIDLLQISHGRSDITDFVALKIEIENKQNRTFEFYIDDLIVDGTKIEHTHPWINESEVRPKETIEAFINGYEYEELSINEHVAGRIIYRDYDSNRYDIEFSEYINE